MIEVSIASRSFIAMPPWATMRLCKMHSLICLHLSIFAAIFVAHSAQFEYTYDILQSAPLHKDSSVLNGAQTTVRDNEKASQSQTTRTDTPVAGVLKIDLDQPGRKMSSTLIGIFFEVGNFCISLPGPRKH